MSDGALQLERFTPEARALLARAQTTADGSQHQLCTASHVLWVLLTTYPQALAQAGAQVEALLDRCHAELDAVAKSTGGSFLDQRTLGILSRAELIAGSRKLPVGIDHVVQALFEARPDLAGLAAGAARIGGERFVAQAVAKPPPAPRAEMVYLVEGRRLLRKRAHELGLTHGEDATEARALRLIEQVTAELVQLEHVLALGRSENGALIIERKGRSPAIQLGLLRPAMQLVLLSGTPETIPTELARYTWKEGVAAWHRVDTDVELFVDLAEQLAATVFAPDPPSS